MVWPAWRLSNAWATFKLPDPRKVMGEAPARAHVFAELARLAFLKGHPYWGLRFLGNALHYLEDCAQPYHAAQVPSPWFLWMARPRELAFHAGEFITKVTHAISYYHFGFEDVISDQMESAYLNPSGNPVGRAFWDAASGNEPGAAPVAYDGDLARFVLETASEMANSRAREAGSVSVDFLPPITEPLVTLNAKKFLHQPARWTMIQASLREAAAGGDSRERFLKLVNELFSDLGARVRAVVAREVPRDGQ
jgi:hypothetical protein